MKLVFKTFLIYIVVQAIITTMIINCSNRGIVYVADFMIQIFQIILILKIYKKTSTKTIIHTSLKENMSMLLLSFIIIISFSVFESGLIAFFIPNYVQNHPMYLVAIINAIIFAPIIEEIIFRGILLNKINKKYSFLLANIIQAFIFALMHFDLYALIFIFLFGILLGIVCKYMNIYCCVLIHMLNNITALFTIYVKIKFEFPRMIYLVLGILFAIFTVGIMIKIIFFQKKSVNLCNNLGDV